MSANILFWVNGAITTFCLAYYLQKKTDSNFFAIIDSYDKPKVFFQNQNLVKFKKTWFYHDCFQNMDKPDLKYLSDFEKKYNLNLWELAINERIFYRFNPIYKFSSDEILSIIQHECKFFEKILSEIKPDYLIMRESSLHQEELLYRMCKKIGIKLLILNLPNISRCIISENPRKLDLDIKLDTIDSLNKNFNELLEYRKSFANYSTIKKSVNQFKGSNLELFKSMLKFLINKNTHIKTRYTHRGRTKFKVLKDEIQKKLKRKFRYFFINNNLEKKIDSSEKFVYFPLAVDEERNLLIATPNYTNQIEVIRNIVKSLPVGYKLYIKENPSQKIRYWRSISEYQEIMNIPNVLLFHPSVLPELLLEKSSLVISINGTSGFDAAFYATPSIIFSDLGYSILPSVSRLTSIHELPKLILESLEKTITSKPLEQYLKFLYDNSFDFNLMDFENKYNDFFYYNGHYFDVFILESKMKIFLEDNKISLNSLACEYKKRLID